jgi:formylglycine-generating enzyme required for sulfatase activity
MASIFLSHSSRNDALASSLEVWLKRNGFDDLFVDHESIRTGDKWTEALRRAKGSCRVVVCLVTPEWLASDECYGEFMAGWYAGRRMIPLLAVAGVNLDDKQKSRLARVLNEDQATEITAAGGPTTLDLDAHPDIADTIKAGLRAAGALTRVGLDPYAFEVDSEIRPEPFPGLESFGDTDADAAIFFGRSTEIAQCLEDLREMRATGDRRAYAIQGASGSGKSSLMKAGVLPRLRRERGWLVMRSFRPATDPLLSFAAAIAQTAEDLKEIIASGTIRTSLQNAWLAAVAEAREAINALPSNLTSEEKLARLNAIEQVRLRRLGVVLDEATAILRDRVGRPKSTVLIPMDQGEELARADGESGDALGDFLKAALAVAPKEGEPVPFMVAFTVRTDSFQELQVSARFRGIATRAGDIRSLPGFRFGDTIERPSARYGVEFEPKLVDALMGDAGGNDALPLLAFTLQRLWRQFSPEGRICSANYVDIGKLSGLIEDAAERALRGIDPLAPQGPLEGKIPLGGAQDKAAARTFLPALAQVNERGAAIRRVAQLHSFNEAGRTLLAYFDKWRLIVKSGDALEVAHESMFREWPRFKEWLVPERARLEALRGVENAAATWNAKGQKKDDLIHRGRRLAEARALEKVSDYQRQVDRDTAAGAYLAACSVAQSRRRILLGAVVLAISSLPFVVIQTRRVIANFEFQQIVKAAENYRPKSHILTRADEAKQLHAKDVFRDCADCPEMVVIPPGRFTMGSPPLEKGEGSERPQHTVTIGYAFAVGRFPTTRDEYAQFATMTGRSSNEWRHPGFAQTGRDPVVNVSWDDAKAYVGWLSHKTGQSYRLLSESEYEYAERAGTTTAWWWGDSADELCRYANGGDCGHNGTVPVRCYPANKFGLFDMGGNVWEWTEDCWNDGYAGAPDNGTPWTTGTCGSRAVRGESWRSRAELLRSGYRSRDYAGDRYDGTNGFRVARTL